jgi:hypothetical protein
MAQGLNRKPKRNKGRKREAWWAAKMALRDQQGPWGVEAYPEEPPAEPAAEPAAEPPAELEVGAATEEAATVATCPPPFFLT